MKTNVTPLDEFVGDRVTTSLLLRPRAGDLEQLRSLVTGDRPDKTDMIADLRQRIVKALKAISASTADETYAAFMLGANMNHIFGDDYSVFQNAIGTSFGISGAHFYQGYSGSPFRRILKPDLVYSKIFQKRNVADGAKETSSTLKPNGRPAKVNSAGSDMARSTRRVPQRARNETAGLDQRGSSDAQILLAGK